MSAERHRLQGMPFQLVVDCPVVLLLPESMLLRCTLAEVTSREGEGGQGLPIVASTQLTSELFLNTHFQWVNLLITLPISLSACADGLFPHYPPLFEESIPRCQSFDLIGIQAYVFRSPPKPQFF
ncbi:hypothetical protein ECG_07588 [Echinococcus granulosus]|uniref:Expressed protein n=1 Tax=Echinococcus granulosus TaxID=6210 RepID=A0A068WVG4_ECHGR|nr:hypothetical protein ECG_07588 [Echinococcus granulosus]CDS24147.1 expressed protein [Echinococcus granulosus]